MSFYTPPKEFSALGKIALFSPKNLEDFADSSLFWGEAKNAQFLSGIYFENQLQNQLEKTPQNHTPNNPKSSAKSSHKIKYAQIDLAQCVFCDSLDIFAHTKKWLDLYFAYKIPRFLPPLVLKGSSFVLEVCQELLKIPYASTATYGTLAQKIAICRGVAKISAQAIGGTVGKNPISIIVPCHRVVGANSALIGYASGCEKKKILLDLESKAR